LTHLSHFEQEGAMRARLVLLCLGLTACASTQRDDELVLTYYYLKF
jgi:hypothetical protein